MQVIYLDATDYALIGKILPKEGEILIVCDASIAGFTVYLPRVNEALGKKLVFKKSDSTTNTVVLSATGEYIDSSETYDLDEEYQCVALFADKNRYWNLNPTASQSGSPDLVIPSTPGNFVTFDDATGGLKDSGISAEGGMF